MCMAGVLFGSNYMGIQKHFFMMNHPNRYVKVVAGVIWDSLLMFVIMVIGVLLYQIVALLL